MTEEFKQISTTNGFMKHNGGILFRTISKNEYEFKTKINENHLNYSQNYSWWIIAALVDAGAGYCSTQISEWRSVCYYFIRVKIHFFRLTRSRIDRIDQGSKKN